MKHFHCKQGSEEWLRLRMGKATASDFEKLITAKKWEPTKGETRRAYAIKLLTELILDMPLSGVTTATMAHGHAYEENARAAYEMLIGKEVVPCGFITNDAMTYGASPDALVGEDGGLEIKCPAKPEIHVEYMMNNESLIEEYFVQTQGQLYVRSDEGKITGIWTDLISYVGILPMVKVRCIPNPVFQEKLHVAVRSFCAEFSDLVARAVDLKYLTQTPPATDWIQASDVDWVREGKKKKESFRDDDPMLITDEDIAAIWGKAKGGQDGAAAEAS